MIFCKLFNFRKPCFLKQKSAFPFIIFGDFQDCVDNDSWVNVRPSGSSNVIKLILSNQTGLNPNGKLHSRNFCSGWTEGRGMLDESGRAIFVAEDIRSMKHRVGDHGLIFEFDNPISNDSAVVKMVEAVKRWKRGPALEAQLDNLGFVPCMGHIIQALKVVCECDGSLTLFQWAKRQPWYSREDECYALLLERLNRIRDYNEIQTLFDEMILDSSEKVFPSSDVYGRALQYLARADKLEASFNCFRKMCEYGCKLDTQTFNLLITVFLNKGFPSKAFEIFDSLEESVCLPNKATYELMIPSLAKSGRLDAAFKLFQEMKAKSFEPCYTIFASLVDSMGKGGRLDKSMEVYLEMQGFGLRASTTMYASMIESFIKAGKLVASFKIWDEMKKAGLRPNFGLYTMVIESHARSGKLDIATSVFMDMEKAGFLPTPSTYSCLLERLSASEQVDSAVKLYNSMSNAGLRPGPSISTALLTLLAKKKKVGEAMKVFTEMKSCGFSMDVIATDTLMVYINDGPVDVALRWLHFLSSSGIRANNVIIRQLFESCMRNGLYESAKPLLELYLGSSKVDLVLYTLTLSQLVRCDNRQNEKLLMSILSATKHKAHSFLCGLFTSPEQRQQPILPFVREFFQGINYGLELGAARFFANVLLNYLVLMGQINRARCVWKVAYENKIFPKAIVFDQDVCWSVDVRNLSVGAALIAVVHSLHRFRKRMLCYGVAPRRIKLVTGINLKFVVAQMFFPIESPFEMGKVVLKARGESVKEWFKKPLILQFILNEIPSRTDILMHCLNVMFPSSTPEIRALSRPNLLLKEKVM